MAASVWTRWLIVHVLLFAIPYHIAAPSPSRAQDDISARIREASRVLSMTENAVGRLGAAQRDQVVEFVAGNALFILAHELGHAVISEFNLPVLGHEEDAADTFATLALLHVGTEFTHRVLTDAARGLLLMAQRNMQMGAQPAFYGEHGLGRQRANTILCLMVGSDPATFDRLARANLPPNRQETCPNDFHLANDSWLQLLEPHLRTGSRPSFWERLISSRVRPLAAQESSIAISYGDASGALAPFREMLITLRILEAVRDFAAQNLSFPRPITIEAKTCGEPNAYWDPQERRLALCYEMLALHADLSPRL